MNNVWLIAKREYLERLRTKAFIMMTILIPLCMGGFVFGSSYFQSRSESKAQVAIISNDGQLAGDLMRQLQRSKARKISVQVMSPTPGLPQTLDGELKDKSLDGYLWITEDKPGARPSFNYRSYSGDAAAKSTIVDALNSVLMREELAHRGIAAGDVTALMEPVAVGESEVDGSRRNARSALAVATVLFLLMYMVILMYGMNVARSIIEEKTSRVFEVLLSAIRPEEILAGKIIGVGGVGLTQIAVWMGAALLIPSVLLSRHLAGDMPIAITPFQAVFFMIYFLLGFLLYSSIAAVLGAITNSEQELQQLNMLLVMPLAFCLLVLQLVITNPSSTFSRVISLVPLCTPLLMNFRISLSKPAPWEIILSIALTAVTICGVLWAASRIYRVGILMYGKKPNVAEILRWLKYS